MRRLGVSLLLALSLVGLPRPSQAAPAAPWPVAGICLQPHDPDTPLTLRSLRVEITLVEAGGVTQAQVWSRFSLVNPSRTRTVQAVVGLPTWSAGDCFFRPADLQGLAVTVNDKSVTPTARPRPQVENETWLAWEMSFDILERQFIEVTYTAPLEAGVTPRVAFALSSGAIWYDQIESAAVVIAAPAPLRREQILDLRPAHAQFDGRQVSWHFDACEPTAKEDVGFTYVARSLWERVEAAHAALAAHPSATNHRALGLLYLTLADRPAFFAQAVAELETAARLDEADGETQRALARAYQDRGRAGSDAAYLELAVWHWDRVRALAPADAEASVNLRRCHHTLAQTLWAQQAYYLAVEHLDAALDLPAAGSDVRDEDLARLRDLARRSWAARLFQTGRDAEAIAVLRVLGDPYEADHQAYAPALARLAGRVSTQIAASGGVRQITVAWTPFTAGALTDAASLTPAFQAAGAQVQPLADGSGLTVALTFGSPADLRAAQTALGQALPAVAAWDPVRAILTGGDVSYVEQDAILWRETRYRETWALRAPAADLTRRRQAVDVAIADLIGRAGPMPEDAAALRLTALQSYRAALERILATEVRSQVTLAGLPGSPQTTLEATWGEDRVLATGSREWNLGAVALTGGGSMFLLLLLGLLAWAIQRSRSNTRRR